jgi:hypothetical protein
VDFDYDDRTQWAQLAGKLHDWLIREEENLRVASKFEYGSEAFWIAFTTAYPTFPGGEWPDWDPAIGLDGDYIQMWFQHCSTEDLPHPNLEDLANIWEYFQRAIARLDDST